MADKSKFNAGTVGDQLLAAARARAMAEADRSAAGAAQREKAAQVDAEIVVRRIENTNPAAARVAAALGTHSDELRAMVSKVGALELPAGAVLDPIAAGWQSHSPRTVRDAIADAAIILRHRSGLTLTAPGGKLDAVSVVRVNLPRRSRSEREVLPVE